MTPQARAFFAFRSPFSWMAIHRLRTLVPSVATAIEFIPYWEPDVLTSKALAQRGIEFHYTPMSKAKHLYILHDTKRLADRFELHMKWPVDVNSWWEVPHLGWLKACRLGLETPFYDAVVAARWEQGANICNPDVIRGIARSVGLDAEAIAGAVDDPDIREEGMICLARAYEDDIFGVPYFRLGKHRFWGLDRLDAFLEVLRPRIDACNEPATAEPLEGIPPTLRSTVGAFDTDTAGGCG